MKALLIATSLLFGTAAMAQDVAPPGTAGQPAQGDAGMAAPDAAPPPPADGGMAPPPAGGMAAPAGGDMAAPAGPPPAAAPAPMASDPASYPPCSRTVKDKCINRGRK